MAASFDLCSHRNREHDLALGDNAAAHPVLRCLPLLPGTLNLCQANIVSRIPEISISIDVKIMLSNRARLVK